jgi:type I restriction enzyme, S subunit
MSRGKKTIKELLEEALVPEEEQPYEVPENWVWVNSEHILNFIGGGTPSKSNGDYWNGNIPWATVKDIKKRFLSSTIDFITNEGLENSSSNMASKNELLLITRMSPGKSTITKISTAINQDLKIVRPKFEIQPYFLWLFFTVNIALIESMSTGTTVKGIQLEKLKKIPFPVPPVNEQKRISEKVERLLSKIDEAKQLIEETKETFELRRAAILDKAFRGELTRKWRKENPSIESGKTRFEMIKKERFQIAETKKEIAEITEMFDEFDSEECINDINWLFLKANMFCYNINCGGTPSSDITEVGDIPFLKVYNIVNNKVAFSYKPQYIPKEVHESKLKKSILKPNDVIMNIVGPPLKKIALIPESYSEMNMNQAIVRFRPIKYVLPKFLYYCLQYDETLKEVITETRGVVGQSNISVSQSRNLVIPIPSLDEQSEIVSKIEEMIEREERSLNLIPDEDKLDELKQSILSKAFRAELGSNDRSEESVIELLKEVLKEQVK